MGAFQLKRYFNSPTGPPSLRLGCGLTSCCSCVRHVGADDAAALIFRKEKFRIVRVG